MSRPVLPVEFPAELRAFVNEQTWTFAKTMPEWPHEYIVRDRVDEEQFERSVRKARFPFLRSIEDFDFTFQTPCACSCSAATWDPNWSVRAGA